MYVEIFPEIRVLKLHLVPGYPMSLLMLVMKYFPVYDTQVHTAESLSEDEVLRTYQQVTRL
jgi:hypothetical protein